MRGVWALNILATAPNFRTVLIGLFALGACNNPECPEVETGHPMFDSNHRPYIDQAIELWALQNNSTRDRVMRGSYIVAMDFPEEICISIQMNIGGFGGEPVYCFSQKTGALTRRYDDVE